MTILTRYIMKTVLLSVLSVLAILSGLYVVFTFIAQTGDIGQGSYSSLEAFLYVLLTLPNNIYLFLPVAALLGTLVGLGLLASHSELLIIRAAGGSIRKVGMGVLYASVVMMLFAFILGAYVGPYLNNFGEHERSAQLQQQDLLWQSKSFWLKDGASFVHVGKQPRSGELQNVVRYEVSQSKLKRVISAPMAKYEEHHWVLHNVTIMTISNHKVSSIHKDKMIWPTLVAPLLLNVAVTNPQNLNLNGLLALIKYQKSNGLDADQYQLKAWRLIFQPLSVVVLMLLALPFVFGPLRSSAMSWQLIVGLIFGLGFFFVDRFFGPFSEVYNLPPIVGAALPSVIVAFILFVLSFRVA